MYLSSLKFYIYSVTYRVIRKTEGGLWSIQHCLLQTLHCIRIPANLIQSLTELLTWTQESTLYLGYLLPVKYKEMHLNYNLRRYKTKKVLALEILYDCKQHMDDTIASEGKYTKAHPCIVFTLVYSRSVKRCRDWSHWVKNGLPYIGQLIYSIT